MDFPDDVCRLAVFPSLPTGAGLLERFTTEQLRDASFQRMRMLERIKQGIGRCTRGDADFAVYYFLDPRFYTEMESSEFASIVSDRTRRQIELGLELTENGMGTVVPVARDFLRGDFADFDSREHEAAPPRPPTSTPSISTADAEVAGWLALYRRDYVSAASFFGQVVSGLQNREREHRAFWEYQQAFAEYLRHENDAAPDALDRSIELLSLAIREGTSSSWFNRLARAANVLRADRHPALEIHEGGAFFDVWDRLVESHPYQSGRFLRWQSRLQQFLGGTHAQVAEALEVIGTLLGFNASRPRGDGVADGLWRTQAFALTIEAKIETNRDSVVLSDVNQADGQRRAARETLSLDAVEALIVTNLQAVDSIAQPALGRVRIITLTTVERLRRRLQDILTDYWQTWSRTNAQARASARTAALRRLPPTGWLERAIENASAPFISEAELFAEWPS
jgi:hypothetical protein